MRAVLYWSSAAECTAFKIDVKHLECTILRILILTYNKTLEINKINAEIDLAFGQAAKNYLYYVI